MPVSQIRTELLQEKMNDFYDGFKSLVQQINTDTKEVNDTNLCIRYKQIKRSFICPNTHIHTHTHSYIHYMNLLSYIA